ncbi:MAG: YhcH/YjgK/YiaL family protein [Treponema sp.]|nr:YhcH/YjgK/YiaL family protein [Treponema sp.]
MILAKFEDLHKYDSLNPLFKKAFNWILSTDLPALATGKVQIDGDRLFANVQEYQTKSESESFFEAHRSYIDIQFLISGNEKIAWAHLKNLSEEEPYNPESDFHKLKGKAEDVISIGGDSVCILFPQDAHMPCLNFEERKRESVRKICMKVKI